MKYLYLLFFLVLLVIGFVLAILNSAPININYYYGWLEVPLSFALLAVFIVGLLLGTSSKIWGNFKLRRKYSRLAKEASLTKQEVTNLRTSPVKSLK